MAPALDGLLVPGDTAVHRLPAHAKIVALVVFVAAAVVIPPRQWWALLGAGAALAVVVHLARIPAMTVLRRAVVEAPFVVFALVLPFVATGPRVEVLGVPLAEQGLLGAWNLLAKATLGVVAAVVLAATTTPRALVAGLEHLRVPAALVQILAFMLRYLGIVADDLRRMRIARESRGAPAGWLPQLRAAAATVGALFVRTYERGERVHQAMLSRGWTGRSTLLAAPRATAADVAMASSLPLAAVLLATAARTLP